MPKKKEKPKIPPKQGGLPDQLTLKVIKAWKELTRKLAEKRLLNEQRAKKGFAWRAITLIPDKAKRYEITKNTKKLYDLDSKEYEMLKILTNQYGIYEPEGYDSSRPLIDIQKSTLEKWAEDFDELAI